MKDTKKTDVNTPEKHDDDELILFGPKIAKACNSCKGFF